MRANGIHLLVSDVDGTLLNGQKELTQTTISAVARLQGAGIPLALISARPPRGLQSLIRALNVQAPCAALNGAVIVDPQLRAITESPLPIDAIRGIVDTLREGDLGAWIYTARDWYVSRLDAAHVRHELEAVGFSPLLFTALDEIRDPILKIVAVGDDHVAMAKCEEHLRGAFGETLSMTRSIDNRLEITCCGANKATAIEAIGSATNVPLSNIATAGDGENDVLMFRKSGFSIAMGQASGEVRRAASETTSSNAHDGLAWAIDNLILRRHSEITAP